MTKQVVKYLIVMWRDGFVADMTYRAGRVGCYRFLLWAAQGCLAIVSATSAPDTLRYVAAFVHHHVMIAVAFIGN